MARHPLPAALARTDTHSQPLKREFSVRFVRSEFSVFDLFPEKAFNTECAESTENAKGSKSNLEMRQRSIPRKGTESAPKQP